MYRKLENQCAPITIALTNNEKYVNPLSKTYCNCCTDMFRFPGNDYHCSCTAKKEASHTIKIKAQSPPNKTCYSCGKTFAERRI